MIFYTGSYTQKEAPAANPKGQGIGCFEFDPKNGEAKLLHYTNQRNPSYIVVSKDKKYLYSIEELPENLEPKINSYFIGIYGRLKFINSQILHGDYACHLAIIRDRLVIANYLSGSALSFPILKDGNLAPCHQIIEHTGTGPNTDRQESAHPHMIYPFNKNHMYIIDLGIDTAKAYFLDESMNSWKAVPELDIQIDAGAGSRHMVMNQAETCAFILSELSGEIFVFQKKQDKRFKQIQKISFIPKSYHGDFGGAAIELHPNQKFLYASGRGSDSIAIFSVNKLFNTLLLIEFHSTEGNAPRDFSVDSSGNWLIVANQDSDSIVVFKINQRNGTLSKCSTETVGTPVNICWLSPS